jgi:hypothetical protein
MDLAAVMEGEKLCIACKHALKWQIRSCRWRFEDCDCPQFDGASPAFSEEPFDPNSAEDWKTFLGYTEARE